MNIRKNLKVADRVMRPTDNDYSPGPLLSIVIPTRNRHECLGKTVGSLLSSSSREFEVIVHDNSDVAWTETCDPTVLNDRRLRYVYFGPRLSVVENCDKAVSLAEGGYVCMIGDDDGVLVDEAVEFVRKLSWSGFDAAMPVAPYFAWPSVTHSMWGDLGGGVFLQPATGQVTLLDVSGELRRVLADGGAGGIRRLPRVYHGFVSRNSLDELKSRAGTYFPGPSPDMANAIGLAYCVRSAMQVNLPLVIAGHSVRSGGGLGSAGKHVGSISAQAHLPADTAATWSRDIPFFWSGPTIYAQSAFAALARMRNDESYNPDWSRLYATCLVYQAAHWRETIRCIVRRPDRARLTVYVMYRAGEFVARRAISFVKNALFYSTKRGRPHANDIGGAVDIVRQSMLPGALHSALSELERNSLVPRSN
jgi:glycosyltransferase involved in cell wall biosynthesis